MQFSRRLRVSHVLACALVAPAVAAAQPGKPMVVVPAGGARYAPVDPAQPSGAQIAVLWGDPATGPSSVLLKFKRTAGALHVHTSDYHLVLLEGTMKHWAEGEEATAPALSPGSYWFQPGGQPHGDACLSDECVMFVNWAGKRDGRLVEPARGAPKPPVRPADPARPARPTRP